MLHGCRQLVPRGVWLSPATSATPTAGYQRVEPGTLAELPATSRRKAGTTSSHHGPYAQGYTRATMAGTERCGAARPSGAQKSRRSPDRSLKPDSVKLESLVIAHQHGAVNTFPGLVHTARHTIRVGCTRSRQANREEAAVEGAPGEGGEVVTR